MSISPYLLDAVSYHLAELKNEKPTIAPVLLEVVEIRLAEERQKKIIRGTGPTIAPVSLEAMDMKLENMEMVEASRADETEQEVLALASVLAVDSCLKTRTDRPQNRAFQIHNAISDTSIVAELLNAKVKKKHCTHLTGIATNNRKTKQYSPPNITGSKASQYYSEYLRANWDKEISKRYNHKSKFCQEKRKTTSSNCYFSTQKSTTAVLKDINYNLSSVVKGWSRSVTLRSQSSLQQGRGRVISAMSVFHQILASIPKSSTQSLNREIQTKRGKRKTTTTKKKVCAICGDNATGFHYGAMACEGCKGFFRRQVQKKFISHCSEGGMCRIDCITRSFCQACRFQKCLQMGMKKENVQKGNFSRRHSITPSEAFKIDVIEVHQETYQQTSTTIAKCLLMDGYVEHPYFKAKKVDDFTVEPCCDLSPKAMEDTLRFALRILDYSDLLPPQKEIVVQESLWSLAVLRMCFRYFGIKQCFILPQQIRVNREDFVNSDLGFITDEIFELAQKTELTMLENEDLGLISAAELLFPRPSSTMKVVELFQYLTEAMANIRRCSDVSETNESSPLSEGNLLSGYLGMCPELRTMNITDC